MLGCSKLLVNAAAVTMWPVIGFDASGARLEKSASCFLTPSTHELDDSHCYDANTAVGHPSCQAKGKSSGNDPVAQRAFSRDLGPMWGPEVSKKWNGP